jgi:hypothetical protein
LSAVEVGKQRAKWVIKDVLTTYKEEGVYIRCSLPGHNIPDCDYLPLKELCLARGRAISPRSSIIRSSSNKEIKVNTAQVHTERIV